MWVEDSRIEKLPEYECAAFGQDHYRTFDGKWIAFRGSVSCQYELMLIQNTRNKVTVSNELCKDSFELLMCKKVVIETDEGKVELSQKDIKVIVNDVSRDYFPGDYPQPCGYSTLKNVEIFSKGLFVVVRVFNPYNPFQPLYEVSQLVMV